ncbi:CaiB/BaiF CoA transferase family protein [Gordonia sp. (in: high G+C Gram-positive bacteria)]|uniref:CaiB/BaiF CoA transferase family protein n=1 Tax=Gordonia sp. (in: high G+C Gram-positive bacteria) TaxID=84139 RepID=UPI0039E22029
MVERTSDRPLAGVRVLDLTVALSGPYATLILAALGAEVIKIESPGGSDIARFNPPFAAPDGRMHLDALGDGDVSLSILARNRGKKSVELDLKHDRGRAIFLDLVRTADVVFENLSDGVVERLGVDYATLREVNPALVYCSLSGLGRPSARPGTKAMDIIVQAVAGVMDTTGFADGPPLRFGLPIADLLAPLHAVIGVQAALAQRERTGKGQHVRVSMLDSLASLLPFEHLDVLQRSGFAPRSGNSHARLAPFGVYRTADGYVSIAAANDAWVASLFEVIGRPELVDDPRFVGRGPRAAHAGELDALIEEWTAVHPTDHVVAELAEARGVPCAPVRSALDVLGDEVLAERGTIAPLHDLCDRPLDAVAGGVPITMSGADVSVDAPAAALGADTDSVLTDLAGVRVEELAVLREHQII